MRSVRTTRPRSLHMNEALAPDRIVQAKTRPGDSDQPTAFGPPATKGPKAICSPENGSAQCDDRRLATARRAGGIHPEPRVACMLHIEMIVALRGAVEAGRDRGAGRRKRMRRSPRGVSARRSLRTSKDAARQARTARLGEQRSRPLPARRLQLQCRRRWIAAAALSCKPKHIGV